MEFEVVRDRCRRRGADGLSFQYRCRAALLLLAVRDLYPALPPFHSTNMAEFLSCRAKRPRQVQKKAPVRATPRAAAFPTKAEAAKLGIGTRPWASKHQPIDYKRCCTDWLNAHPEGRPSLKVAKDEAWHLPSIPTRLPNEHSSFPLHRQLLSESLR